MKTLDVFGKALEDFYKKKQSNAERDPFENIITWTNISDEDELPLPYLFRSFEDMPKIEQEALHLCTGHILDVGCGAGSHSLYLQNKNMNVKAIDISDGAVNVAQQRGVKNTVCKSLLDEKGSYDTILLLMNGTGIFQRFDLVTKYLRHLKGLLKKDGQILIDSSDISYMYDEEDLKDLKNQRYYGELDYFLSYKGEYEYPMTWLYLDFESLKKKCEAVNLQCDIIVEGKHHDYLARIKK
jgi:2-polyprenyl-3-methyl-5-hydroxy-6-metoxy-1,4-benzoquinol methylase